MTAETQSYIFRWRSRFRAYECLNETGAPAMTDIVTLPVCVSRAVMLCVSTSITIKTSENPTIAKTSSKTIKLLAVPHS